MDLGITDRKAIVCASSRGLGKGCAKHLAEAGCQVIVNGRNHDVTMATAEEISKHAKHEAKVVLADVSTVEGQQALLEACPQPDILVNNNGGPPRKDFRELDRAAMLEGVTQNMVTPIELIQATIDGMSERGFGRIVNITSLSVYTAIEGLDLSSGRSVADNNVTINQILPGKMDTDRLMGGIKATAANKGISVEEASANEANAIPAKGYITGRNILVDGGLNQNAF